MGQDHLIAARDLEGFFFQQVREALTNQHTEVHPHTEYYLVRLLSDYCQSETLFSIEDGGNTPLAIQYLSSFQADPSHGFRLLKNLGDFTLYISGFFQDSLSGSNVDLDYYVSMGGSAYHHLYSMMQNSKYSDAFRETFFELAKKFTRLMDILSEVSENSQLSKNSDLLRLYEKWLNTGSDRIRKRLNKFGIFPTSQGSSSQTH